MTFELIFCAVLFVELMAVAVIHFAYRARD